MLLASRMTVKMLARVSSGASMPPSGHVVELLRTKKYADSRTRKIIASVAISTTMPHHAVG